MDGVRTVEGPLPQKTDVVKQPNPRKRGILLVIRDEGVERDVSNAEEDDK